MSNSRKSGSSFVLSRRGMMASTAALIASPYVARAQSTISIRLAVGDPITSSVTVAAKKFGELAAQKTSNRVNVQVFPDGVLFGGDQNAAVNQLGSGALQMLILSSNVFASFEPRMNAMSLPYLFASYDELEKYMAGEPGQTLLKSLDRLNIRGLAMMLRTFRHTTTREQPITHVENFKGLKLRVPNNQLFVKFFQAVGANATPMAFTEVYTALQLKAIDGQENPVEIPLSAKFYEVQKHLNLTGHIGDAYILAVNEAFWGGLPDDVKPALEEAAAETAAFKSQYDISEESKVIEQLRGYGMTVNELAAGEKEKLQQISQGLYPQFEALTGKEFLDTSLKFLGRA